MLTLLLLALLAVCASVTILVAASPTFYFIWALFDGWADRCRAGPELADR